MLFDLLMLIQKFCTIIKVAYIFQDNSLVVPIDTLDSHIQYEVDQELIKIAFGPALNEADTFVIPALDLEEDIRGVMLPKGELPEGWKAIPLRQVFITITGGTYACNT